MTITMENLNNFCTLPVNCCPETCPVTSLDPAIIRFSKSFQNALSKTHPLDLKLKVKSANLLDDGKVPSVEELEKKIQLMAEGGEIKTEFSEFEKLFLPLNSEESIINRFVANQDYLPCCECIEGCYLCPSSCCCCVQCFTCGIRPFQNSNSSIITTHAIYHFASCTTSPWSCVSCFVPPGNGGFITAWAPIRALQGQEFEFTASGVLPAKENGLLTKYPKEPGPSDYEFIILLEGGMEFVYRGSSADHNWLHDPELSYEQYAFSELQLKLLDIENGGAGPGIQEMERLPGEEPVEGDQGCAIA